MIEKVKIKKSYPVIADVIMAIIGLGLISMVRVLTRKLSIRNSIAGGGFWGGFMVVFGILMIITNLSNERLTSGEFWWATGLWLVPTVLFGVFLLLEKRKYRMYMADVDKLLHILLQKKMHQKNDLRRVVPTNRGGGRMLEADNIGYMLNDLQACGVLSYLEQEGYIEVTFLMPPLMEMDVKTGMQEPTRWVCKSCGAENQGKGGIETCEYCGGHRN